MKFSHCPDCRSYLSACNKCSCGWVEAIKINLYQCQYIENQHRCNNEGTISKQVRGNSWYCNEHHDK